MPETGKQITTHHILVNRKRKRPFMLEIGNTFFLIKCILHDTFIL